ncbi:MAG: hypothetical protein ACP5MG_02650 [Verrucomicrobiia bacterium]
MADNIPNLPPGAVPPTPDQSKVQPKKETVRIQLPPKPTSAPTIKLPTLPQGGGATAAPTVPPPKPAVPPAATPQPPTQTPSAAVGSKAQPVPPPPAGVGSAKLATQPGPKGEQPAAVKKEAPKASQKPSAPVGAVSAVSVLDKALAIAAMVTSLAAVFTVIYLLTLLQDALKGGGQ